MSTSVLKSKLTRRSQTTIPNAVKHALRVAPGDEIGYVIEGDSVRLVNATPSDQHDDPVLGQFLAFLAQNIAQGNARNVSPPLVARIQELTADVPIDHDADIVGAIAP
jgi:antitoxin PrlF